MRRITAMLVAAVAAGLSACGEVVPPTEPTGPSFAQAGGVREQVIVVFHENTANPRGLAQQLAATAGGELSHTYEYAIKGFAGSFPAAALEGIQRNPHVAYIEPDGEVWITATTQNNATWGLDRIDQRNLPLNGTYVYNADGTGVRAYIIDTGIRGTHNEFTGRMLSGFTSISDGRGTDDCNGHGTHVAGTVGGTVYGVAKKVGLVPVRVLNCQGSGTWSGVIAGVDWVTGQKQNNASVPMVANMSLGGGASSSVDDAVKNSVAAGVTYAVAAGNSTANACNYSPARVATALTVGATTSSDARASYSNFGSCVNLFAPGSSITSAWRNSNTSTNTISGTSMASPHVAGVAALYLQGSPGASASAVANAITSNATTGKVTSAGSGSPNLLLYSGFIGGGGGGGNQSPTASFTYSCTDLTCSFNGTGSSDPDGSISSYAWNFGDGTTGTGATVSKSYASGGTRTVTLTVTDNDGATGSQSHSVTVIAPPPPGDDNLTLAVSTRSNPKWKWSTLTWNGSTASNIDVIRDGVKIATTGNSGTFTDQFSSSASTFTYQVCNANTTTCSNSVTVSY